MPRSKVKVDRKSNVPEAEKQSTLVLAHLGALEPVLDQLPAQMGLELKDAVEKFQKALDKSLRSKTKEVPCFMCDGTGLMCAVCGESDEACGCEKSEPTACEDCDGAAYVRVPLEGC
jgi:hypothetical protein